MAKTGIIFLFVAISLYGGIIFDNGWEPALLQPLSKIIPPGLILWRRHPL